MGRNEETRTRSQRVFSRGRKITAALVGMALVGGAAYAALNWVQARGNGVANRTGLAVNITSINTSDSTNTQADTYLGGDTIDPGVGRLSRAADGQGWTVADDVTGNGTASPSFSFNMVNGYSGYQATLSTTITTTGAPLALQTVQVVPDGGALGDTWAAGTQPVVAWVPTDCSLVVDNTGPQTVDVNLMLTDAAPLNSGAGIDLDLVLQFVPVGLDDPGQCNSTAPTSEVAP